jgi:hypothetical protein
MDKEFAVVCKMLEIRFGEENAITIDELAVAAGLFTWEKAGEDRLIQKPKRRQMEHLLETRVADLPFLVISSTKSGYFRPRTERELDHWWATLNARIKAIASRMHTGRVKARDSGFRYLGNGRFSRAPVNDLFETNQ